MSFNTKLTDLLKTNPNFVDDEGELILAAILDSAWKLDADLISLLLSDYELKSTFFEVVNSALLFKAITFIEYISQKNFLDNSFTRFRNRIGLTIDGKYLGERSEVSLAWAYKDCILEGGQTREYDKRKEIFFNEVLAQDEINRMFDPKVLTDFSRYTTYGAEPVTEFHRDENGVIRENLIIKGNNLITLHTLKNQFRGKIKLIYVDPPYNTGGSTDTFVYNNSFKHSSWLTFIKNRIDISRDLLTDDGFIAVTIDHEELFYLGVLLDEVYGRENRVGIVTILINPKGRQHEQFFSAATEYMLVYAKNKNIAHFNKVAIDDDIKRTFNNTDDKGNYRLIPFSRIRTSTLREYKPNFWYPIYVSPDLSDVTHERFLGYHEIYPVENGNEYSWKTKLDTFIDRNHDNYFMAKEIDGRITILHKYHEQQVLKNLWTDKKYFPEFQGTNLLKKLLGENIFSYPKSLYAVLDTIRIMTNENDIILDFFAGSGTTGHAVMELNNQDDGKRTFILCEQLDYIENVTKRRIEKVIQNQDKGDFIYCQLKEHNQRYIDFISSAITSNELMQIWKDMAQNSFLKWYVNPKVPEDAIQDFIEIGKEENGLQKQKRLLMELLDKNQLYVNLSEIDDAKFNVSEEDKALNKLFYGEN